MRNKIKLVSLICIFISESYATPITLPVYSSYGGASGTGGPGSTNASLYTQIEYANSDISGTQYAIDLGFLASPYTISLTTGALPTLNSNIVEVTSSANIPIIQGNASYPGFRLTPFSANPSSLTNVSVNLLNIEGAHAIGAAATGAGGGGLGAGGGNLYSNRL